jgi:nitroimidazol reductase NimA-like FMN-containing flavoprotein (pyridoxamine 5'-phosphate oxidase superfamily)
MRRTEKEIEDQNIIHKILSTSIICRIGLFDEEYPYVIPVNYGYKNNSLYVHCAPHGKKIDLIKKNNRACFEIEEPHKILEDEISCKWTTKYRSVIGFGNIEIITDFEEKKKGLDVIMIQHGKTENTYSAKLVNQVVILKLNIKNLTGKQS